MHSHMIHELKNKYLDKDSQDGHPSTSKFKDKSKRKLLINHKHHQPTSSMKVFQSAVHYHKNQTQLKIQHFADKYLMKGKNVEDIYREMSEVLENRIGNIQSLRLYRDQLKFLSLKRMAHNVPKINYNSLKVKAKMEQKLATQKHEIQFFLKEYEEQIELIKIYSQLVNQILKEPPRTKQIIDLAQEQQIRMNNLELQTNHLVRELADEKRKNIKELKQIQEEIQELRVEIQQKEDILRDYKAKLCTLHIKLHNRKMTKSKERNLSLSIKKYNNQNHQCIKEAFIGNSAFKNFSKEVLEKVSSDQQLIKLKFYSSDKQSLSFQCLYKSRDGQVHSYLTQQRGDPDDEITRDKDPEEQQENVIEVFVKYLFNIKFYYKSKIVGVEFRAKTEKGNKHVQLGNCSPNVQHELLTLINKEVVTMGSFWHGKQMVGVSIWYSQRMATGQKSDSSLKQMKRGNGSGNGNGNGKKKVSLKSFDEYYA